MKRFFFFLAVIAGVLFQSNSVLGQQLDRAHTLKIYNWSDYIDEDLLEEFEQWYEEQTGEPVKVIYQLFDINEVMLAKIEKGHSDYDLTCPSDYIIERMLRNGLLLPINKDFGDTPNYIGNVSPFMVEKIGKIDAPGKNPNDYAVGYMWGTSGFLYNKAFVTEEDLSSWSALWNPKFEGKILMKDAPRDVYSPLLIYANYDKIQSGEVDIEQLMFDMSDESLATVEELINRSKPNIYGWEADFGKEIMTQNKAWFNLTWSGDAEWAIREAERVGVNLAYTIPEEGSNYWFDGWVIPKYAVNTKAASYFINYMCRSESAIRNMDVIGYVSAVATPEVLEHMQEQSIENGDTQERDMTYFFGEGAENVILNKVMYPDKETFDRLALMHDSGDRTQALLEMWSRVKGDNLNPVILGIIAAVVILIAIIVISRKSKDKKRKSKNGKNTKKK